MDLNAEYNWGNKKCTLINLQISRAREWVGQGQAWCLFSRSSQFNVEADCGQMNVILCVARETAKSLRKFSRGNVGRAHKCSREKMALE